MIIIIIVIYDFLLPLDWVYERGEKRVACKTKHYSLILHATRLRGKGGMTDTQKASA